MYGKRRIKIEASGTIVLAGNHSYIPIGRFKKQEGILIGKLRNVDSWELSLDETNSIDFQFQNVSDLRNFARLKYAEKFID